MLVADFERERETERDFVREWKFFFSGVVLAGKGSQRR